MNEIEVTIKVYSDILCLNELTTLTCDVYCEYDEDGQMSYGYGWDITIADEIEENCEANEWKMAITYSLGNSHVAEFLNVDGEAKFIHSPNKVPFTPFAIFIGKSKLKDIKSKFKKKIIVNKSSNEIDEIFGQLYQHPEAMARLLSEILKIRGLNFNHFDYVYEPDIKNLQMLQWVEHYDHMFYITKFEDVVALRRVRRQYEVFNEIQDSLKYVVDELDGADKRIVTNFVKKLDQMRNNAWDRLLNLSLARTHLE
jgi:hypothetical protein